MPERLQTENHRIDLAPDLVVGDLPRLHAWVEERVAALVAFAGGIDAGAGAATRKGPWSNR